MRVTGRSVLYLLSLLVLLGAAFILRTQSMARSAELSPLETRVLGQTRWLRGGPASLRVIVADHRTENAVAAKVQIVLIPEADNPHGEKLLFSGATNRLGTVDLQFTVPAVDPGNYRVVVHVDSSLGIDTVTQPVQIEESAHIMLTSDKPLYQPGQTMHIRALAINMANRAAFVRQPITFEVEDARGNKVFKEKTDLSDYGTAALDFTLAGEVNMGTFTLRAILPQGEVEKKVRVDRYVLPKFKVNVLTDKPYYLPGETVKGTVQADYFFGKPVANGGMTIDVSTIDIGVTALASLKGQTNANGTYTFEYTLPGHFVGQPFEQGKAVVEFHCSLVDGAQHTQESYLSKAVVKDPVLLAIVPESRSLVPGIKNRVFIAAATPDGTPLRGTSVTVTVDGAGTKLRTDNLGLALYEFIPERTNIVKMTAMATGADGRTGSFSQTLSVSPSEEGILLRATQSLAKVGDRVNVSAISTTKRGTIYLDVIRDKQTILTKALAVRDGQAAINLPITHDMVGTLELHAYKILPNEDIVRDTQIIVVTPADDLHIGIVLDKQEFRPGQDAALSFTVTDGRNHPLAAALGLAIVDESVFAISEMQPGLEKIYFTLEKELMEPKYEIHGLTPVELILNPMDPIKPLPLMRGKPVILNAERQRAAAMLFAAVPTQDDFGFHANTYQQRWEQMKPKIEEEMRKAVEVISNAVNSYRQKTNKSLTAEETLFHLVDTGYLKSDDLKDHWGNFYKSDLNGAKNYDGWFTISSAGPDGRWGTNDDITGVSRYGRRVLRRRVLKGGIRFRGAEGPGAEGPVDAPMLMNAPMVEDAVGVAAPAMQNELTGGSGGGGAAIEPVRVREYFPETMYWNPLIITDDNGKASISVPVADSITTWRMSLLGNTALGQMGSATAPMRVFQPFFADIDLPVSLTQHDSVSIPVAVYNYLPGPQDVTLRLDAENWFTLQGPPEQVVHLEKNDVKVVYFPISVTAIGHFSLTVHADGTQMSDALRRAIDVMPDGKEFRQAINDTLQGKIEKTVTIPAEAIAGASNVWVKLYPGTFSQVVEGLDSMLRMPNVCFEQTSSTTYPNVLVLDYLNATKRVNPELKMKAEQYINIGYQRLVTFECKSGGFSWFGNEPAHEILTAYGLLEFSDMSRVHEVDPALIARTQSWLANRQKGDGTWDVAQGGIAEGIINRQTGAFRSTAYIAWALAESGYRGPQVGKAVDYIKAHLNDANDPYTLAVILNLLTRVDRDGNAAATVAKELIDQATVTGKTAYWQSDTQTFTGAKQEGADLETTGLAAFGLVKWGRDSTFASKVLTHLVQSKDSFGTWSSTQGTVWALKALIFASTNGVGGGKGNVTVSINGQQAAAFAITPENSDVMRQVDLTEKLNGADNHITLEYTGEGAPLYQIVTRYYLPWEKVENLPGMKGPLSIDVKYDKTTLAQDDTVTVTVTVANTPEATVEMPLIDLGIPPGFIVDTDKLEQAVQAKKISKYTVAARQIIIYIEKLAPGQTIELSYRLKAKYPIKARTPQSRAYPYYNPDKATVAAPQDILVKK